MTKTYDIRKIEELHQLRADLYEERKHLSVDEQRRITNENGKKIWREIQKLKQQPNKN